MDKGLSLVCKNEKSVSRHKHKLLIILEKQLPKGDQKVIKQI